MSEYGNLEIYGVGKQRGGRFGRVLIAGSGKITGNVECDRFELPGAGKIEEGSLLVHGPMEIDGACKVEGCAEAETLEVNGSLKTAGPSRVAGNLEVNGSMKTENASLAVGGRADICGSLKTEGDFSAEMLDVTGAVHVEGSLKTTEAVVDGVLKVEGEVQAERFRAEGVVKIDGLLNAETVELGLAGEDEIASIGGGSVRVYRSRRGFGLFNKRPHLLAELIEADEISLEYTDVETVRGVNVHIGPECVVDRVEYSGTLTTDASASIGTRVKLNL